MSQEEYRSIIYAGSEDRNREYKRSFPWERSSHGTAMAKVTKSILAMSNVRDGGHIVIGVEEDPKKTSTRRHLCGWPVVDTRALRLLSWCE
jgi:predicted HTH transcriptional regulator